MATLRTIVNGVLADAEDLNFNFNALNNDISSAKNNINSVSNSLSTQLSNTKTSLENSQAALETELKTELNESIANISATANSKVSQDLSNINATGKANILDFVAPNYGAGYSVSSGWTAPKAGWVACYGTSGEGSYSAWNIAGKEVYRDDQSWGGGRAGGQGSRAMAFIRKGQVLTKSGGADGSAIFYPCVGN